MDSTQNPHCTADPATRARAGLRPHAGVPTVFRLYTEDLPVIRLLDANGFDGATLTHGTGVWRGQTESSIVVEIVGEFADMPRVIRLAESIARENKQSEVLVTWQSSKGFDVAHVYGKWGQHET